ncbi:beta-galactoside-binding lectin [Boleophthalmus pectinirostris]|uniref:beta-galactoside-binding lectin n=1 Tax=Boleophthalmus pectinirostris TaxID=150288 RepID=UPI00242EA176|nr:beta-galactoside-binding lectin [Boleophthalmus pectinirostris]
MNPDAMTVKNMSFKVGQTLTLGGTIKPDAAKFAVNISPDGNDITMHVNPRFDSDGDQNTVVCNSYQDGAWCEEQREAGFPFTAGGEFKMSITFNPGDFLVVLPDGSSFSFPNRMGRDKYSVVSVDGDARITTFEIK